MPATQARITRKTPVVIRPATLVKAGDTLSTRKGDVLTVEKCYRRNGQIVLVLDGRTPVEIPEAASLTVFAA